MNRELCGEVEFSNTVEPSFASGKGFRFSKAVHLTWPCTEQCNFWFTAEGSFEELHSREASRGPYASSWKLVNPSATCWPEDKPGELRKFPTRCV